MRFRLTAIVSIDPCFPFVRTQEAVRFRDGPLPMHPCRGNRVEPWPVAGPPADDDTHADGAPCALVSVRTTPGLHGVAAVPGRVGPAQQPSRAALGREWGSAPRQTIHGDRPDGAPCDTPAPPLVRLRWRRTHPQPLTGQGLGIGVRPGRAPLLQRLLGSALGPTRLMGLGQPAPPHVIAHAQRPRRLGPGPRDQPSTPVLFRREAGSGLVIQGLARVQATPNRRRARRLASSLTTRGVSPWAQLTSAVSRSVPRRVGWPHVRGRWCHKARRDSPTPASKRSEGACGRDQRGRSTARPRWGQAGSVWRTG
jgi:hypothetical protein